MTVSGWSFDEGAWEGKKEVTVMNNGEGNEAWE